MAFGRKSSAGATVGRGKCGAENAEKEHSYAVGVQTPPTSLLSSSCKTKPHNPKSLPIAGESGAPRPIRKTQTGWGSPQVKSPPPTQAQAPLSRESRSQTGASSSMVQSGELRSHISCFQHGGGSGTAFYNHTKSSFIQHQLPHHVTEVQPQ